MLLQVFIAQPVLADSLGALAQPGVDLRREEICDNYVLGHRDPVQYAETLVHVATLVGGPHREAAWVGMLQWPGKLELRITGLVDCGRSKATRIGRLRPGLCLAVLLLTSITICGMTIRPRSADAASGSSVDASPTGDDLPDTVVPRSDQEEPAEATKAEEKPATEKLVEDKSDQDESGKPSAANPPSAPRADLDVWFGLSAAVGQAYRQQADRFNESQVGIQVKVRTFDSYAALQTELEKALNEGHPPDLAVVEIHQIAGLAAAGNIVPLDSFMSGDPGFHPDELLTGVTANLRYEDKLGTQCR